MARPQIRPPIFIALQNILAALLFATLLGTEMVRRLLDQYPQSELLWRLSTLADRSVMPVLQYTEGYLPTPDKLLIGLSAGVVIPLLAWWTRYWFATALAGHLTLFALIVMINTVLTRSHLTMVSLDLPDDMVAARASPVALLLILLALLVLLMCIADHVAYARFLLDLRKRLAQRRRRT